jgi:TonB C terminal
MSSRLISRLLAALCLLNAAPALAGWHGECVGFFQGEPFQSLKEDEAMAMDIKPWLLSLSKELENRQGFAELSECLLKELKQNQMVECTFLISKNGTVSDLKIHNSSGSPIIDRLVSNYILESAPYVEPPDNIPCERGVLVEFYKVRHLKYQHGLVTEISPLARLNPDTREKHFSFEQYLAADSEHPWRK